MIPVYCRATFLDPRNRSHKIHESKPDPGISPEVDERVDAGVTQRNEQEHGVDVSKDVAGKRGELLGVSCLQVTYIQLHY